MSFGDTSSSSFSVVNGSTITAVVGSGTSGEIKIITLNGVASLSGFNTIVTGPEITSFSPMSGAYKTIITIIGKNFDEVNFVTIGGVDATNKKIINSNKIEAEVPSGAASGDIKVERAIMAQFHLKAVSLFSPTLLILIHSQ